MKNHYSGKFVNADAHDFPKEKETFTLLRKKNPARVKATQQMECRPKKRTRLKGGMYEKK